jgi:hypothetical protein
VGLFGGWRMFPGKVEIRVVEGAPVYGWAQLG